MTRPHITRTDGQIRLTYTAPMITVILSEEQLRELMAEGESALIPAESVGKCRYCGDALRKADPGVRHKWVSLTGSPVFCKQVMDGDGWHVPDLPTSQIDLPTSHPEIPHLPGWTRVIDAVPDVTRSLDAVSLFEGGCIWRPAYSFACDDASTHPITHWRYTEAP